MNEKTNNNSTVPAGQAATALTTLEQNHFDLIPFSEDITEIIAEEMNGLGTIPFDTLKIPSGGGLAFELPGETEDTPTTASAITGILIDHHPVNAYWETEYDGSNNQPDCSSFDGRSAVHSKTGEQRQCDKCPYNQFGSDPRGGNGKACKNCTASTSCSAANPSPCC